MKTFMKNVVYWVALVVFVWAVYDLGWLKAFIAFWSSMALGYFAWADSH